MSLPRACESGNHRELVYVTLRRLLEQPHQLIICPICGHHWCEPPLPRNARLTIDELRGARIEARQFSILHGLVMSSYLKAGKWLPTTT